MKILAMESQGMYVRPGRVFAVVQGERVADIEYIRNHPNRDCALAVLAGRHPGAAVMDGLAGGGNLYLATPPMVRRAALIEQQPIRAMRRRAPLPQVCTL